MIQITLPGSRLAAWRLAFEAGAAQEPEPGAAALLAAALRNPLLGTPAAAAVQRLEALGTDWDVSARWDRLEVQAVGRAEDSDAIAAALFEVVSRFDPSGFDRSAAELEVSTGRAGLVADPELRPRWLAARAGGHLWALRRAMPLLAAGEAAVDASSLAALSSRGCRRPLLEVLAGPPELRPSEPASPRRAAAGGRRPPPWRRRLPLRRAGSRTTLVALAQTSDYVSALVLRAAAERALLEALRFRHGLYAIAVETEGCGISARVEVARPAARRIAAALAAALRLITAADCRLSARTALARELMLLQSTEHWAEITLLLGAAPWAPGQDAASLLHRFEAAQPRVVWSLAAG